MKLEDRMNRLVSQLGLGYRVGWIPDEEASARAAVKDGLIIIHDIDEAEAWSSLVHEILELKLRPLLSYYRGLVNALISFIDKRAYIEKEKLLECLPTDFMLIMEQENDVQNQE